MDFPVDDILNRHLAMGLFAFYMALVSLWRVMAAPEFFRLTAMKKVWGRTRGLILHFVSNVALPLIAGIVFFSQGVATFAIPEKNNGEAGYSSPSPAAPECPPVTAGAEASTLVAPDWTDVWSLPIPAVDILPL